MERKPFHSKERSRGTTKGGQIPAAAVAAADQMNDRKTKKTTVRFCQLILGGSETSLRSIDTGSASSAEFHLIKAKISKPALWGVRKEKMPHN